MNCKETNLKKKKKLTSPGPTKSFVYFPQSCETVTEWTSLGGVLQMVLLVTRGLT